MRFLYFLPGHQGPRVDGAVLDRYGLRDLFRGTTARGCQAAAGPEGPGCLVNDDRDPPAAYRPTEQIWAKRLSGGAWTGICKASPPLPEELLRGDWMEGHEVTLRDRHQWVVPVAKRMPEGTGLPEVLLYTAEGIRHRVAPEFLDLWEHACRLWDADGQLPVEDLMDLAAKALAVNYRLGRDELNLLTLVTSANLHLVTDALIDAPTLAALRALSDPKAPGAEASGVSAPPSSSPDSSGSAGSCPATGPRSPTSAG